MNHTPSPEERPEPPEGHRLMDPSDRIAELTARVAELEKELRNRDESFAAKRKYVAACNHPPEVVIDSENGPICCECWALEEKARADALEAKLNG